MTLQNFTLGTFAQQGVVAADSFESIATTTVGAGGAATVTFSSIPQTYTHLQIRAITRCTTSTGSGNIAQFNSDTTFTNYRVHWVVGDGASASSDTRQTSAWAGLWFGNSALSTATTGIFGVGVVDILDYTNTNKNKVTRTLTGLDVNGTGGDVGLYSGLWLNTSAITSITLRQYNNSGNFAQYSQFALYGIKAA